MWVFLYFKPKIKMLIPSFENHRKISELILIQRSSIFSHILSQKGFILVLFSLSFWELFAFLLIIVWRGRNFSCLFRQVESPSKNTPDTQVLALDQSFFISVTREKKSLIVRFKNLKSRSLGIPIFEVSQIGSQIRAWIGYRSGTL